VTCPPEGSVWGWWQVVRWGEGWQWQEEEEATGPEEMSLRQRLRALRPDLASSLPVQLRLDARLLLHVRVSPAPDRVLPSAICVK